MDTLAWSSEHFATVQSQAPGPRQATKEGVLAGRHLMIMHQAKRPPGPECPALPMPGSFLAAVSSMTSGASHILCVSELGLLRTPVLTYGPVGLCQALCVGPWLTITILGSLTASDPICGELGWRLPVKEKGPKVLGILPTCCIKGRWMEPWRGGITLGHRTLGGALWMRGS